MNQYPYALSNVLDASDLLFSAACGFLFLEDTQAQNRMWYKVGLSIGYALRRRLVFKIPTRSWEVSRKIGPADQDDLAGETAIDEDECSIGSERFHSDE